MLGSGWASKYPPSPAGYSSASPNRAWWSSWKITSRASNLAEKLRMLESALSRQSVWCKTAVASAQLELGTDQSQRFAGGVQLTRGRSGVMNTRTRSGRVIKVVKAGAPAPEMPHSRIMNWSSALPIVWRSVAEVQSKSVETENSRSKVFALSGASAMLEPLSASSTGTERRDAFAKLGPSVTRCPRQPKVAIVVPPRSSAVALQVKNDPP